MDPTETGILYAISNNNGSIDQHVWFATNLRTAPRAGHIGNSQQPRFAIEEARDWANSLVQNRKMGVREATEAELAAYLADCAKSRRRQSALVA